MLPLVSRVSVSLGLVEPVDRVPYRVHNLLPLRQPEAPRRQLDRSQGAATQGLNQSTGCSKPPALSGLNAVIKADPLNM